MEKISVIIPVWNAEKFLEQTINSVLNQTYKNVEIVCVNDGSTDGSLEILKRMQKNCSMEFVIVNQENQGGSSARNTGLDVATGDYIAFLDNDDIYHPQYLEILYYKLKENNCDVSVCKNTLFCDDSFSFDKLYDVKNIKTKRIYNSPFFQKFVMKDDIPMLMWLKLAKKEVYNNVRFSLKLPAINDILLNMEVLYNSKRCITINEKLIAWRYRATSQTHIKLSAKKLDEFYYLIEELNNFYNTHKMNIIERVFIKRLISKKVYQVFVAERLKDGTFSEYKDLIRDKVLNLMKLGLFKFRHLNPYKALKMRRLLKI